MPVASDLIVPERPSLWRRIVDAWNRFWFTPADPLPLGLVRICAGLVILYVHVIYTADLQNLLGEHAWLDRQTVDVCRREVPYIAPQVGKWDDPAPSQDFQRRFGTLGATNLDQLQQASQTFARLHELGIAPGTDMDSAKKRLVELGVAVPDDRILDYYARWGWDADQEARFRYFLQWNVDPQQPELIARGNWLFSPWVHVTDPKAMLAVHTLVLVVLFLFTIGFCTRVTSVLAWLAVIGYIQRTPTSVFGMDTMINVLALYLMIGPSGAALSVDRLLTRFGLTWRALRGHRPPPDLSRARPSVSANLALRLIQIHLCFIYMASGLSKLQGQTWWNGTAPWGTMANPEFSPLRYQWYMDLIQFLASHPTLWYLAMTGGTAFTLFFEISFPYLAWQKRTRWVMLAMAVGMHTMIALFMGLVTFSLAMTAFLVAFVPAEALHRLFDRLFRGRELFRLTFNVRRPSQLRAAALVRAADVWDQVELVAPSGRTPGRASSKAISATPGQPAAEEVEHLQLTTPEGTVLTGYPLFQRLTRSLRLLWPVALFTWLPGGEKLASRRFPGTRDELAPDEPAAHRPAKQTAAVTSVKPKV